MLQVESSWCYKPKIHDNHKYLKLTKERVCTFESLAKIQGIWHNRMQVLTGKKVCSSWIWQFCNFDFSCSLTAIRIYYYAGSIFFLKWRHFVSLDALTGRIFPLRIYPRTQTSHFLSKAKRTTTVVCPYFHFRTFFYVVRRRPSSLSCSKINK